MTPEHPGIGASWARLAESLPSLIPVEEIDAIWAFRTIRREARDFGTAIISRVDGNRRRIYTASYIHTVKGKTRGQFESALAEVGSGPIEALAELLALVPKRAEDEELPVPVSLEQWFPPAEELEPVVDEG